MLDFDHRTIVVPTESESASMVVRWAAGVVVLDGTASEVAGALRSLRPDHEMDPASGLLIERLRMLRLDDFAAGVSTPGGIRVLARGRGQVGPIAGQQLRLAEETRVAVAQSRESSLKSELIEDELSGTSSPIWIGVGSLRMPHEDAASQTHLDLTAGSVPGSGVILALPIVAPIDPTRGGGSSFAVVDFSKSPALLAKDRNSLPVAAVARPESSVLDGQRAEGVTPTARHSNPDSDVASDANRPSAVYGIRCSREHFNNPSAAYCQVCGISMIHLTHRLVQGTRPTLGFLVFDDGATFALDRSYLLGREPESELSDQLSPLVADDNEHTVSRSHAELTIEGWDVTISDLGSTNGTFLWHNRQREWERVLPNRPVVVEPGTSVALGRKTFVYEPVARSV